MMRSLKWFSLLAILPATALAQTDVEWLGLRNGVRPPPIYYEILRTNPNAFQFSRENGWIRRGQAVSRHRRAARASETVLLAPQADVSPGGVLRGTVRVPVFLPLFSNMSSADSTSLLSYASQSTVQDILFRTTAAPPYSVTTYYKEISNDSLEVTGNVLPWSRVSRPDTYYEDGNNGLSPPKIRDLIIEMVAIYDGSVDFGQFDNDGPDGIPNSSDDDGYVDALVILHPEVDGACGNSNIWAHKWSLLGVQSQDPSNVPGMSNVEMRDYIIQGGQGGANGCTAGQPPAIGLVTHEIGHIFDLPDLYCATGCTSSSYGIGEWGLMGSGNWRTANSPAHMEAWSRAELGWVTEVIIDRDTTLQISPVATSDTAYILPIRDSYEYFLLENRQKIGSDMQMRGQGLLIWHIDSVLAEIRGLPGNSVNAFAPEAVRLIQADGRGDLQAGRSPRSDAGDPWPGDSARTVFGMNTNPASNRNNGEPTFIEVRNITQVSPGGPMSVDIVLGVPALIAANDTLAQFTLDGLSYRRFVGLLSQGQSYALDMPATQTVNDGGNRYTWLSWSNAQPRTHSFTAGGGDTITAQVQTEYLVQVTIDIPYGTVTSSVGDVIAGQFVLKGDPVELVATPDSGAVFEGWFGDATSGNDTLQLTMGRPYRLTAAFGAPLVVEPVALPTGVMGANYAFTLSATGGTGGFNWQFVSGALPAGVQLSSNGSLGGRPTEAGTFDFVARVASGSQMATESYSLGVTMPVLSAVDVVTHIVGAGQPLTADQIRFLDVVGNKNGRLDVGDFLGWVQVTGQSLSASVMRDVTSAGGGKP